MKKSLSVLLCLILCSFTSVPIHAGATTSAYGRVVPTDFSVTARSYFASYSTLPLKGIVVTLEGFRSYSTTTDSAGFFEFRNILPGEYYLTTKADNFYNVSIGPITIEEGISNEILDIPLGSLSLLFFGLNRDGMAHFASDSLNYLNFYFTVGNRMRHESNKIYEQSFTKAAFEEYIFLKGNQLSLSDVLVMFYYGSTFIDPDSGMIYLDCADAKFDGDKPIYETLISSAELKVWLNKGLSNSTRVIFFMESENSFEFCKQLFTDLEVPLACVAAAYGDKWYELGGFDLGFMTYCIGGILKEVGPNGSYKNMNLSQLVALTSSLMPYLPGDMDQEITFMHSNNFTSAVMLYKGY